MTSRIFIIYAATAIACAAPSSPGAFRFRRGRGAGRSSMRRTITTRRGCRPFSVRRRTEFLPPARPTQDRNEQAEFARLARQKHRLEISAMNPNRAILAIGDEDWPFPVPIVRSKDKWSFDASETPVEMQARRIGANELDAIEICHGYVEAQIEVRRRGSRQGRHAAVRGASDEYAREAGRAVLGRSERSAGARGLRPRGLGRRRERDRPNRITDTISAFWRGKAPMRRAERTITL